MYASSTRLSTTTMNTDRAFKIIDVVIRSMTCKRLGQRAIYKSYLYPRILYLVDDRYKNAKSRRYYVDMSKLHNELDHKDIPFLVSRGLLSQYWIRKPVRACCTVLHSDYKDWHKWSITEFYNKVHNAIQPKP
jgi:hypothetical protein